MNKAAQALGRMARGKPKNYSAAELALRTARLAEARAKRWPVKPISTDKTTKGKEIDR